MTEALQLEIRTLRALLDSERDPAGRAFAPLADAYRRAGKIPDAIKVLREGIAKHPDFATGHVVAAQLYVEQGLSHEAAFAARRALELDAENVTALKSLLRALDETGEAQEARGVRSLLTSLEPDFTPDWTVAPPRTQDAAPEVPTSKLGSREPEPSPPALALEPEPEAIPMIEATGMIDLTTIGPLPFADLPSSALAPEPPAPTSKGVGLGSDASIDLDLIDFATGGDEPAALAPAVEEPMLDLPLIVPEETDTEAVLDLPLITPEPAAGEPVMDLALLAPEPTVEEPVMDLPLLAPEPAAGEPVMDLPLLVPEPTVEEPVMELAALAPDADEAVMDVGSLAPEAVEEPVMELADLAPEPADEIVMDVALLAPEPTADEHVLDVAALAPDAVEEPVMELADLAPDVDEPVTDVGSLAPEAVEETVMEMASLAPDAADDEAVMDVGALAPDADEAVMDIGSLAPSAVEEPVMELADLAPERDAEADETVMDLALLAPDPSDEPVVERAQLAPDPDETVVDLASLAPEREVEEPIYDLAMLAPASAPVEAPAAPTAPPPAGMIPDDEPVFDLDSLAPAIEPSKPVAATGTGNGRMSAEEAVEIGFLSPDEPDAIVIDLDELRPDTPTTTAASSASSPVTVSVAPTEPVEAAEVSDPSAEDDGAPIYTRTLAELYAAQGATKQALRVLRHLLNENPQDADLARRIADVEAGTLRQPAAVEPEEEVDTLARDLAESGRGAEEVDSPFTWSVPDAEAPASGGGPTIREYFDGLLEWEPREDA